jgi:Leucine-rich repeat (LRR) protein
MDMSPLRNIENLDITNNLISDIDILVLSLQTLTNLKVLIYPVKK